MFVTSLRARGFADLADFSATDLGRVVRVAGPTPQTTALADALQLAFAALSEPALRELLGRWQVCGPDEEPELVVDPFPEQAIWADGRVAGDIVGPDRTLQVDLSLRLDPPLYGALRQQAARDPRLVAALSSGAELRLSVGAVFTRSLDTLALSIDRVSFGEVGLTDADRARWADRLLRRLGGRLARFDAGMDIGAAALDALTSRDRIDAYRAWSGALGPDGPALRVVAGPGGRPQVLADERPLSRWGRRVRERAALAATVHLRGVDILWAETEEEGLEEAVEGAASPLEQVFEVSSRGELSVHGEAAPPRPTTPLPTTLRSTPGA